MKYVLKSAAALVATALAAAMSSAQAQEITLKVAHFWAPGAMAPNKVIQPWCDKINKESGGKLKCQMFPAIPVEGMKPAREGER